MDVSGVANKGYRRLQIVVTVSRFQHNVAGFVNDGGRKLVRTYLALIQTLIAYVQPKKHQESSLGVGRIPIVKNIIA